MSRDKTRSSGGVLLDPRRALTIKAVSKVDSSRSEDPFKIPKQRVSVEDEIDVSKSPKKCPKVHWSQLASNGVSSHTGHHNGSQTFDRDSKDLDKFDLNRRQVKVILTDILKTKEGRSFGCDLKNKCQSAPKVEAKESQKNRRFSAEPRERTRASPRKNASSSTWTESASKEPTDTTLSKETRSPLSKRPRRSNSSLKITESNNRRSNEKESCPLDKSVSSQVKHVSTVVPKQKKFKSPDTDYNDELCPVEDSDPTKSSSASPLHSERTSLPEEEQSNLEQVSEVKAPQKLTPSRSRQHNITEQLGSDSHSKQTSETERGVSAEKILKEVEEHNQEKEDSTDLQQNGEVMEEGGGSRESVLRLSLGTVGEQMEMGLTAGEVTPSRGGCQNADPKLEKEFKLQSTPEPIVLSSEEEEEDVMKGNSTLRPQTLEGAKDQQTPHRLALTVEKKKTPDRFKYIPERQMQTSSLVDGGLSNTTAMELQISALYMGGLSILSNGLVKITRDQINISLKDPSGTEVKACLATEHLHKYSVWDGSVVKGTKLVEEDETPPPSLLLLWLSEFQAQQLSNEISASQSVTRPGVTAEGSVCVLLCMTEALNGIEGALLASIMDIVGLRHGSTALLSSLSCAESMKLLQCGRDTHLLQLLSPKLVTQSSSNESVPAPAPAVTTTTPVMSQDPEVQTTSAYTLCHNSAQGTYNVSMVAKPGPEWAPYKHRGPARKLIQFPPPPCKRAITVTTEDLECLDSGEFLNDVIIDFYLKYLLVQKAPQASVKRSHVFSSFFYKQLTRRDNANEDSSSTPAQLRRHQRVRTWTRHVDIFEKDFLFVPVNQEAHWYLVVVCFPGMDEPECMKREDQDSVQDGTENSSDSMAGSEIQEGSRHNSEGEKSSDENSSKSVFSSGPPNCTEKTCGRKTVCKRPCILIMDSLKLSVHERIFKLLREYLQVEWETKRGGHRDFSAEKMVGSHCRVPLQDNSSDCGLYLLQYAESFLLDPVVHFELPLRLECWFPRQQVREKREEIRDLVLRLYRSQQGSLGKELSEDKIGIAKVVQ